MVGQKRYARGTSCELGYFEVRGDVGGVNEFNPLELMNESKSVLEILEILVTIFKM